jgi:hypothetical protein
MRPRLVRYYGPDYDHPEYSQASSNQLFRFP